MSGTLLALPRQTRAYLLAAATIGCWATVGSAFKLTLRHLDHVEMLLYSSLVSVGLLGGIVAATGRLAALAGWPAREWARSALLGLLSPFAYYLVLFKAYDLLPAQEAVALNYVWPIVLVLMSVVVLRQPMRVLTAVAMLVSFGGALVVSTGGDLLSLRISNAEGAALALGSSVIWGLNWVYGARDRQDAVSRLFLNFCFGALYVIVWVGVLEPVRVPPLRGLAGAAYVGTFEMGITYVMWLGALRLSRTTAQVSNLIYLTPFLSLVVVHFVLGEHIRASTLGGLALIVGGIVLQRLAGRPDRAVTS